MSVSAGSAHSQTERRNLETRAELIARIAREFRGMAGLTLTDAQACRLFHLPPEHCARILRELERAQIFRRNSHGQLIRGDDMPRQPEETYGG
jgi:hypothetical protein